MLPLVVKSTTYEHARHGFKDRMSRASYKQGRVSCVGQKKDKKGLD